MKLASDIAESLGGLAALSDLTIRVSVRCMSPVIPEGAELRVRRHRLYWPGDVVVFRRHDGRLLVHRVIGWYYRESRWKLMTRADNASSADAAITAEHIVGAVSHVNGAAWRVPLPHRLHAINQFAGISLARIIGR